MAFVCCWLSSISWLSNSSWKSSKLIWFSQVAKEYVVIKLVKGGFNPLIIKEINSSSMIGLPVPAASWFAKLLAIYRKSKQAFDP
jgi:hypothetical protein